MSNDPIPSAEQILFRLREAGVPQAVIAQKLAIPQSAVSNLFAGKRHLKLAEANILMSLLPAARRPLRVPVIGMAGAGNWLEAIEHATETLDFPPEAEATGSFAVQVVGQSMNMLLPEGSFALVDPTETSLYSGRIYLLRNGDGEATIKRYRTDPARFEPVSTDPSFTAFEIGSTDFAVIGRITGALTKF